MSNWKLGDIVFVQKAGSLMKGTVIKTKDHGGVEVETDDYTFHFNDKGFDKRTIQGSTCRLHPYSEEAYETWERGVLFEKIKNFHFSRMGTPDLKKVVTLIEESESENTGKDVQSNRSHLTLVDAPSGE